jgi:hypothetical protein
MFTYDWDTDGNKEKNVTESILKHPVPESCCDHCEGHLLSWKHGSLGRAWYIKK